VQQLCPVLRNLSTVQKKDFNVCRPVLDPLLNKFCIFLASFIAEFSNDGKQFEKNTTKFPIS
jgi:hypothetical protein